MEYVLPSKVGVPPVKAFGESKPLIRHRMVLPPFHLKPPSSVQRPKITMWKKYFIDFCVQYLDGEGGMILDMPFLERITEGEIRVFMLRNKVVNIVHKKPADVPDAFSATLFSGAKYSYESPEKWSELVQLVIANVPIIQQRLGNYDLPLIWTIDFILDTDKQNGNDKYVMGEINASCVGFTTHLELSKDIADEIVRLMEAEAVVNPRWVAFAT